MPYNSTWVENGIVSGTVYLCMIVYTLPWLFKERITLSGGTIQRIKCTPMNAFYPLDSFDLSAI